MTMLSNTFNALRCNAKMSNPIYPQCQMVSDGGYDDPDTVLKNALVAGWSEANGRHYCPAHTQTAAAPLADAPVRRTRNKPTPPEPDNHGFHEGNQ